MKIAVLPGDGIGVEIVAEALKVLRALDLKFEMETAPVGGAAYEQTGHPLPESTLNLAKQADAILFGAVGDWKYDSLERQFRPEQAILGLRADTRQWRAQLMCHIARELALRLHTLCNTSEQGIDGLG